MYTSNNAPNLFTLRGKSHMAVLIECEHAFANAALATLRLRAVPSEPGRVYLD